MGVFVTVMAPCPKCREGHAAFQSKAVDGCATYGLEAAPTAVKADIVGETGVCVLCGELITVKGHFHVWAE